jgi:chromosome segregation ATPase
MDNLENVSDKLKIERLSSLVKSLYENIDDLKSKLDEKNITQSNKAFDELYEKHRNLENNFDFMEKSNEDIIKHLNNNLDIAQKTINNKNKEIDRLLEKYKELKKDFDEVEKDYAEALDELDQTTFTLEKIKASLDISKREYRKLITSYTKKRKEIEELKDSKSKLSQAEETIASYQKTYEKLRKENEALIAQSSYDKETIGSYQKTYDTLRKKLEESDNKQSSLQKIYDNLYDAYRSNMLEHNLLKEFLKENLNHTQAVYEELYKLRKEKAILENNAAKQEKEIENLVNTISGMENELNKKDSEIDDMKTAIYVCKKLFRNY